MRRREFIVSLGVATTMPFATQAQAQTQTPEKPVIGFLGANTPTTQGPWTAAFLDRLRELGWVEGRTMSVEYRWAEGHKERAAEIAAEFVRLKVALIFTSGTANVLAAKEATSTIPIVFAASADPVGTGVVAALAKPGGNVTGFSVQQPDLAGKRLEILREAVPGLRRLAIIGNAGAAGSVVDMGEAEDAARRLGFDTLRLEFRRPQDIIPLFEKLEDHRTDALYVASDPLVTTERLRINVLALGARLPAIHAIR